MSYIYANLSGGSGGSGGSGWRLLWLWLRLGVWLWLERVRRCHTYRVTQSLYHTLIVGVQPPTLGPHLGPHPPHLGLQLRHQCPQALYLCGVASTTRALGGAGVIVCAP